MCVRAAALAWGCLFVVAARAELLVTGVDGELRTNIERHVRLSAQPCDAPEWRLRQLQNTAVEEARAALAAYSYFEPLLNFQIESDDTCWQATLEVELGRQTDLTELRVELTGEGSANAALLATRSGLLPKLNAPLDQVAYQQLKNKLRDQAVRQGFLDARYSESKIDVYPEKASSEIVLILDTGGQSYVGPVTVSQEILDAGLFDRLMTLKTGQPYSAASLEKAFQNLSASGYFSDVRLTPDLANRAGTEVPVTVFLRPGRKHLYTIGAGFSTDEGARLRMGYENRRVNRAGHQASVDAEHSQTFSRVDLSYRRPLADPVNEWLSLRGGYQRKDTETAEAESFQVALRRLNVRGGGWVRADEISIAEETFQVGSVDRTTRLLVPGVSWTNQRADNAVNPREGRSIQLNLRGSVDREFSSTRFLQAYLRVKAIRPAPAEGRWLASLALGTTAFESFDVLPASYRYFAGGSETVRGYGFETLGPKDSDGFVIGGPHLLAASIEYDRPLWRSFDIAVFADAGNAFRSSSPDFSYSVGLGLKWRSPIGPLRVYLAHPLTDSSRSVRLHISMGPEL